jgi:hypothetical protein
MRAAGDRKEMEKAIDTGTTICDASRAYGNAAHTDVYLSLLIAFPTCPAATS